MKAKKEAPLSEFQVHQLVCAQCKRVDVQQTSTLVNVCHPAASMLRDHLHAMVAPVVRAKARALRLANKDEHIVTKKKLQEVMRYVGD